jgi:hypothetical protein
MQRFVRRLVTLGAAFALALGLAVAAPLDAYAASLER